MAPKAANKTITKPAPKKSILKIKAIASKKCVRNLQLLRLECPICFEYINTDTVSATTCGHVFCTTCIQKALKRKSLCPICHTRLKSLRGRPSYHPLYFDTCTASETETNSTMKSNEDLVNVMDSQPTA